MPREGSGAADHLIEDAAETPDIRAFVYGRAARLLRAHVRRGPENHAGLGHRWAGDGGGTGLGPCGVARRRGSESLGQTEVKDLDGAIGPHLDVGGLEVAVDDALLVRRFERLGDLSRDRQGLVEGERATRDPLRQVVPLDQLHHQSGYAATLFQAVYGGDVWMIQRGEYFGFALEPGQSVAVRRQGWRQDLDRHLALEPGVVRAIHLPHAALAEQRGNLVGAEATACGEDQVAWIIWAGSAFAARPRASARLSGDATRVRQESRVRSPDGRRS